MTKRTLLIALAATAAACGDDVDPSPSRTRTTAASGLSTSYARSCARCHGDRGEGSGRYPSIPGAKDESAFVALVRAGRDEMPAFSPSDISDADLKADYLWLTTKR